MNFDEYKKLVNSKKMVGKYFSLREAIWSDTALKHKINNIPSKEILSNIQYIAKQLDLVRAIYGKPIFVSSWYRNEDINNRIGGVADSYHTQGLAVDIYANDMDALLEALKKIKYDKLIRYTYKKQFHIQFHAEGQARKDREEYYLGLPNNEYKMVYKGEK